MDKGLLTQRIKQKAKELDFDFCGISQATFLEEEAPRLENWLNQGKHGKMSYMENHFDKRLDPRKLVEGAKSVISLSLNYFPEQDLEWEGFKISRYAYGKDYHDVIKEKLFTLLSYIKELTGDIQGRAFVDSAPVMDKAWAKKSGLGWMGKNTNLIRKGVGSYFFLAELIIDIEMEYDGPVKDYCGTCTKCIDACPTEALNPYTIDASKCISYLTIELKDSIPDEFQGKYGEWIFGCDICQEVCPWNRFSVPTLVKDFFPSEALKGMTKNDWTEITKDTFDRLFKGSAIKRSKWEGLIRNIKFIEK